MRLIVEVIVEPIITVQLKQEEKNDHTVAKVGQLVQQKTTEYRHQYADCDTSKHQLTFTRISLRPITNQDEQHILLTEELGCV